MEIKLDFTIIFTSHSSLPNKGEFESWKEFFPYLLNHHDCWEGIYHVEHVFMWKTILKSQFVKGGPNVYWRALNFLGEIDFFLHRQIQFSDKLSCILFSLSQVFGHNFGEAKLRVLPGLFINLGWFKLCESRILQIIKKASKVIFQWRIIRLVLYLDAKRGRRYWEAALLSSWCFSHHSPRGVLGVPATLKQVWCQDWTVFVFKEPTVRFL